MKASELNFDELKKLKKELKLPLTKPIIYFKRTSINFEPHSVIDFEITKELSESKILNIYLENGDTVSILSDYLEEMQKKIL